MPASAATPEHTQHAATAVCAGLSRHGFAVLPSLVPSSHTDKQLVQQQQQQELLTALQAEAAALQEQVEAALWQQSSGGSSHNNTSCVLQVLPDLPRDAAACPRRYWARRRAWPCQPAVAAWLQSAALRQLLGAAIFGSSSTATPAAAGEPPQQHQQPPPLLYNEQYIIKPPASSTSSSTHSRHDATAFAWHYDAQYATAGGRSVHLLPPRGEAQQQPSGQPARSLALWVALDAMTPDNGALVLLPGHRAHDAGPSSKPPACTQQPAACVSVNSTQQLLQHLDALACRQAACGGGVHAPPLGLLLPAGAAVLFWDDLWHASGPNASMHERRAYMAQFSAAPASRVDSGQLVALAVPLDQQGC